MILGAALLMAAVAATLVQGVMCLLAALQLALPLAAAIAPAPVAAAADGSATPRADAVTVTTVEATAESVLVRVPVDLPRGPATGRLRPVVPLQRTPALLRAWLLASGGWTRWERLFFPLARQRARKRLGRGSARSTAAPARVTATNAPLAAEDVEDDLVRPPPAGDADLTAQIRRIAHVSAWAASLALLGCIIGGGSFNRLHKLEGAAPGNAAGAGLTATAVGLQVMLCAFALWVWREQQLPGDWVRAKAAAAWLLAEVKGVLRWLRAFFRFVGAEARETLAVSWMRCAAQYAGWKERRRLAKEAAAAAAKAAAKAAAEAVARAAALAAAPRIPVITPEPLVDAAKPVAAVASTITPVKRRIALVRSASAASGGGSAIGSHIFSSHAQAASAQSGIVAEGATGLGVSAAAGAADGGGSASAEPEQTHFYDEVPLPAEAVAGLLPEALTEHFSLFLRTPVSPNALRLLEAVLRTGTGSDGSDGSGVALLAAAAVRAGAAPLDGAGGLSGSIIVGYPKDHVALTSVAQMRIGSAAIAAGSAAVVVMEQPQEQALGLLPGAAAPASYDFDATAAAPLPVGSEAAAPPGVVADTPTQPAWLSNTLDTQAAAGSASAASTSAAVSHGAAVHQVFDERQLVVIRMSPDGSAADVVPPSLTASTADPSRLVAVSAAHAGVRLPRTVTVWSAAPALRSVTTVVASGAAAAAAAPENQGSSAAAVVPVATPATDAISVGAAVNVAAASGRGAKMSDEDETQVPVAAGLASSATPTARSLRVAEDHDVSEVTAAPAPSREGDDQDTAAARPAVATVAAVVDGCNDSTGSAPPQPLADLLLGPSAVAVNCETADGAEPLAGAAPLSPNAADAASAHVSTEVRVTALSPTTAGEMPPHSKVEAEAEAPEVTAAADVSSSPPPLPPAPTLHHRASRQQQQEQLLEAHYTEVPVPPGDLEGTLPPELLAAYEVWTRTPAQDRDMGAGESDAAYAARCAAAPAVMLMVGYPSGEKPAALGLSPAATAVLAAAPASGGVNSLHFTEAQLLRIERDGEGNLTVLVPAADALPAMPAHDAPTSAASGSPSEPAAASGHAGADAVSAGAIGTAAAAVQKSESPRRPLVHAASQAHLRTLLAVEELERRLRSARV